MANINEYIKWRGDIPLNEKFPFNEIDSMILARFSYLIFNRIEMNEQETVKNISEKMKNFQNEEFLYNGDKELITNMGKSIRYQEMTVTDYIENNIKESEGQFSAITIHTGEEEMYISYIGTNASIYGWKEDFNMAFMDNVPCQIEGKDYLEKIAGKYQNKKIRIGGHSKGGNVAIYAAITADSQIQERIIKVYNYDGPGFNKQIIEKYGKKSIIDKIETYFPQDSIIGRILNHEEKCSIVQSTQKGILQHDIYSWQVLGTEPVYAMQLTDASENINMTITNWLENTTNEQRKIFFDSIFELFYSTEANTFGEITQNLTKNLSVILKRYGQISPEDKKTITEMIKTFIKYAIKIKLGRM
ncbi:MAG: DUF2974 domain-containing protein [Clostridia bacterium]|nr:DUF2974 domain-containing protein [Clostridia bacterium]